MNNSANKTETMQDYPCRNKNTVTENAEQQLLNLIVVFCIIYNLCIKAVLITICCDYDLFVIKSS